MRSAHRDSTDRRARPLAARPDRPSIHDRKETTTMKTSTSPLRKLALGLSTASLVALAAPAQAAPADFQIDPMHTFVYFEVVHFGTSTVRGRFNDV